LGQTDCVVLGPSGGDTRSRFFLSGAEDQTGVGSCPSGRERLINCAAFHAMPAAFEEA